LGGEAATFANVQIADIDFEGRMNGNVTGSEGETLEGTSQQSMYDGDRDRAFDLLGKPIESNNAQTLQISKPGSKKEDAIFDDRASDLLGNLANTFGSNATSDLTATEKSIGCERELLTEGTAVEPINAGDGMVDQVELSEMHSQPNSANQRRGDAMPSSTLSPLSAIPPLLPSPRTTEDEVEELRRLVREEQQLLEEEMQLIVQWRNHLRSTIQRVQQLENETIEIMSAVGAERTNLFKARVAPRDNSTGGPTQTLEKRRRAPEEEAGGSKLDGTKRGTPQDDTKGVAGPPSTARKCKKKFCKAEGCEKCGARRGFCTSHFKEFNKKSGAEGADSGTKQDPGGPRRGAKQKSLRSPRTTRGMKKLARAKRKPTRRRRSRSGARRRTIVRPDFPMRRGADRTRRDPWAARNPPAQSDPPAMQSEGRRRSRAVRNVRSRAASGRRAAGASATPTASST